MEKDKIKGVIESILFASGRRVQIKELKMSLELEEEAIEAIINEMREDYKLKSRGIEIVMLDNGYTLASKKEYHEYIYNVIDKRVKPSLSQAALEVLAIIAYNPKITRAEIETIRGVGSDASIYRLLEHNLITEAGKLDLPGKPIAYKVTDDFLKKFGLNTLDDLPELPKYKMDENRQIVIDDVLRETQELENEEKVIVNNHETVQKENEIIQETVKEEGEGIDREYKGDNEA